MSLGALKSYDAVNKASGVSFYNLFPPLKLFQSRNLMRSLLMLHVNLRDLYALLSLSKNCLVHFYCIGNTM